MKRLFLFVVILQAGIFARTQTAQLVFAVTVRAVTAKKS